MRLRSVSFGLPWNMPQSTRTRAVPMSSRYCEPVTVVAPPRNVSSNAGDLAGSAAILAASMFAPLLAGEKVTLRPGRAADAEPFVRRFVATAVAGLLGRR